MKDIGRKNIFAYVLCLMSYVLCLMSHSVVFLGTSAFAVPSLRKLAGDDRFKVSLVITQPDRPTGRRQILTPPPVKIAALELDLPIEQPEKLNTHIATLSTRTSPDFLIVVSYGQILSEDVLSWPNIAAINVHASLLPRYRGASPIQHAILGGDTVTGVTIQRMVKELDAGPILSQESLPIGRQETFLSLHDKLADVGAELLLRTLISPLKPQEQRHVDATFCRKLSTADAVIDPRTMSAESIDRRVRALNPWPSVKWNNAKLLKTSLKETSDSFPLPCAESSALHIVTIQPAGGKPMSGEAYRRGHPDLPAHT